MLNIIFKNSCRLDSESKLNDKSDSPMAQVRPSNRLRWIDQERGFVMFLLLLTITFPPNEWMPGGSILFWFFGHPDSQATYMTLFDVGAAVFIFIIGLSFSISFHRRIATQGLHKAVLHVLTRYGMILILGLLFLLASAGSYNILEYRSTFGITVVRWDVIPTLGAVGFVTLPFIFITNPKIRMILAYGWMILYQILMIFAGLKTYAQASVHGGFFGTIFGFSGIMIVATALGDYIFHSPTRERRKYSYMMVFGAINILGGLVLSFLPGWEAAKRQVSFSYCLISIGVTIFCSLVFVYLDRVKNLELKYFQALGRNPFLTYLTAETLPLILDETIGNDLGMGPLGNVLVTLVTLIYTSILMWYLYKKNTIVSTIKATFLFILIGIVLALFLMLR